MVRQISLRYWPIFDTLAAVILPGKEGVYDEIASGCFQIVDESTDEIIAYEWHDFVRRHNGGACYVPRDKTKYTISGTKVEGTLSEILEWAFAHRVEIGRSEK